MKKKLADTARVDTQLRGPRGHAYTQPESVIEPPSQEKAGSTQPASPLDVAQRELELAVDSLHGTVSILFEKLESVLRTSSPVPCDSTVSVVADDRSLAVQQLNRSVRGVLSAEARIIEIIERLDT